MSTCCRFWSRLPTTTRPAVLASPRISSRGSSGLYRPSGRRTPTRMARLATILPLGALQFGQGGSDPSKGRRRGESGAVRPRRDRSAGDPMRDAAPRADSRGGRSAASTSGSRSAVDGIDTSALLMFVRRGGLFAEIAASRPGRTAHGQPGQHPARAIRGRRRGRPRRRPAGVPSGPTRATSPGAAGDVDARCPAPTAWPSRTAAAWLRPRGRAGAGRPPRRAPGGAGRGSSRRSGDRGSGGMASSTRNGPIRVRRSTSIRPPQPSASPTSRAIERM